jgi:hypothetical protein
MEKTSREQLAETAHEYGWRVVDVYAGGPQNAVRFKRYERVITVAYTKTGSVKEIRYERPGLTLRTDRNEKGKYDLVDKWLRQS